MQICCFIEFSDTSSNPVFAELLRYLPDVCATFETAFFEQADAGFVLSRNQCHYVAEAFLADDLFQSEYSLFSISSSCKLRFQVEGQLYRDAEGFSGLEACEIAESAGCSFGSFNDERPVDGITYGDVVFSSSMLAQCTKYTTVVWRV